MDNISSSPQPSVLRSPDYVPSQNPPPVSGFKGRLLVIVVIGILAVALGSILLLKLTNKSSTKSDSKSQTANTATPKNTPIPSSTLFMGITTPDKNDANLLAYSSPCMTFNYTKDFNKLTDSIVKDNLMIDGVDILGYTSVSFKKIDGNKTYIVSVQCGPSKSNLASESASLVKKTGGKLTSTKVAGIDANEINVSSKYGGSSTVTAFKDAYHLLIRASWQGTTANDSSNDAIKLFNTILNSFKPKGIV